MQRRGPKTGYDFANKRHQRRVLWARFRKHCGTGRSKAQALLMPSAEGDEIDVALANGFREENLHCVDRNAAIVAHLKRRYPKIHTYGVELEAACERMGQAGVLIRVANFDLCSNVNASQIRMLMRMWLPFTVASLVAITMLRGRERELGAIQNFPHDKPYYGFDALQMGRADVGRCQLLGLAMGRSNNDRRMHALALPRSARDVGMYRSGAGTQTMLWCIYRFAEVPFQG